MTGAEDIEDIELCDSDEDLTGEVCWCENPCKGCLPCNWCQDFPHDCECAALDRTDDQESER